MTDPASPSPSPVRHALTAAIVGGGINGVMTAWRLAELGYRVELFERGELMSETSHTSTKLLHGGLRYLENREFRLVREALHERTWWVQNAPQWAKPIELFLPIYRTSPRPRWVIGAGLTLYDVLAGRHTFGRHRWHGVDAVLARFPNLRADGLRGAYSFFDAQMHDRELGLWAADQARAAGVRVYEHTPVKRVGVDGTLQTANEQRAYDWVVNVAGPWAGRLLTESGISSKHVLDLVRGSHMLLPGTLQTGFLVEIPHERRICFVLPYDGAIMVGTTEVRQTLDEPIVCSDTERAYLLNVYNTYFADRRTDADILQTFAGVRPLLRSADDPSKASREYAIERNGRLVTVFGGKWTTARALARRVGDILSHRQ